MEYGQYKCQEKRKMKESKEQYGQIYVPNL